MLLIMNATLYSLQKSYLLEVSKFVKKQIICDINLIFITRSHLS